MAKTHIPSLKRHAKNLDVASGLAFFFGIILARLQLFIPIPIAAIITNSLGLAFYAIGYGLWIIECLIDPDKKKNGNHWYGFASVKQQFNLSSLIGLAGVALGIGAIFLPILLIPACWLFSLSNVVWAVGEHQKRKHPPKSSEEDPYFSLKKQTVYSHYALVATGVSIMTSLLITLAFFIPAVAVYAVILGAYIGGIVVKAWVDTLMCSEEDVLETTHLRRLGQGSNTPIPEGDIAFDVGPLTQPTLQTASNTVDSTSSLLM